MFKVYDSDAGTFLDVREILDLDEADFEHNTDLKSILSYMNKKDPVSTPSLSDNNSLKKSPSEMGSNGFDPLKQSYHYDTIKLSPHISTKS